ncbi:transposable element Tcb2 transposase [Trichonephila clavipes]|nr:transposable element Tcb2 transposase [Trichonephila clavipes]
MAAYSAPTTRTESRSPAGCESAFSTQLVVSGTRTGTHSIETSPTTSSHTTLTTRLKQPQETPSTDQSSRSQPHRKKCTRIQPTVSSAAIQAQVILSLRALLSSRTIRRHLTEKHLGSRCPLRVLLLKPTHRRFRLEGCHAQRNWTAAEWNQVVGPPRRMIDESRFHLCSDENRVRVGGPRGELLNTVFALQRHTTPTAGVILWGALHGHL